MQWPFLVIQDTSLFKRKHISIWKKILKMLFLDQVNSIAKIRSLFPFEFYISATKKTKTKKIKFKL